MTSPPWTETHHLNAVGASDLACPDVVFRHHRHLYRTVGSHLASGGMGAVYMMERYRDDDPSHVESVVGKTFHAQHLYQLRTDEITRRDHQLTLSAVSRIAAIEHPSVLPTYISSPIADNHLFVTPRMGDTLLEAILRGRLSPRRRTEMMCQALEGLATLHQMRLVHRDFTLRNILLDKEGRRAILFDFDLALSFDDIGMPTYRDLYRGRIFGSPGYSVPPEVVDPSLMDQKLSIQLDIFAIGAALFSLFTTQLPYGETQDMWGLLVRIAEGVVFRGQSRVQYPDTVPEALRGVIERCLEREAGDRYPTVAAVIDDLRRGVLPLLDDSGHGDAMDHSNSVIVPPPVVDSERLQTILSERTDASITRALIQYTDDALKRHGYLIQRSFGRVKGHPIFLATPDPDLLAAGQFPDNNIYPKIVTAISLQQVANPRQFIELWLGHFLPTLRAARQGLTSLYKVIPDEHSGHLFLFSEYIAEPRFAPQLANEDLSIDEALGLGYLVARQVAQLHERGMAHNNVSAGALLFRGDPETRLVYPSMIGLVEPSMEPKAMAADVRTIAGLTMSWIRPVRVEALQATSRARVDALRARLASVAFDESQSPPPVAELGAMISDAIAGLDYNFSVLRDAGGDLVEYLRLLVSHRLFGRLWKS